MDKTQLAIATITLARTPGEAALLQKSLIALAAHNIPVFICDGGSTPDFLAFLQNSGFTLVQAAGKGVWHQAQASVKAAYHSHAPFIFYTEPDKLSFFANHLQSFIKAAAVSETTGVILASRSRPAYETFPRFQQQTEQTINFCCAEVVGAAHEFTYGPFLMNAALAPRLNLVTEDVGWGWRPFVFCAAARLGFTVSSHTGDFTCPEDQRTDMPKERLYRIRQLQQNLQGILLGATVDL